MTLSTELLNKMVKRGAKRYSVDAEARALAAIEELMAEFAPKNWAYALEYNNFATPGTATLIAAEVEAGA